jgi:hypothetical protein
LIVTEARPDHVVTVPENQVVFWILLAFEVCYLYIMGRSAKFAKRPTKKEKSVSKTAKDSRKPLPPPPPPRQQVEETEGEGTKGPKKRRMMRAKVDQVSQILVTRFEHLLIERRSWARHRVAMRLRTPSTLHDQRIFARM